jgi:hypothetical protein
MPIVISDKLLDALQGLGIGEVRERVRRVVIDLQAGKPAIIHVEKYGDERLIEVFRALEGVEIRHEPAEEFVVSSSPFKDSTGEYRPVVRTVVDDEVLKSVAASDD